MVYPVEAWNSVIGFRAILLAIPLSLYGYLFPGLFPPVWSMPYQS